MSQEELHRLFEYRDGHLYWKVRYSRKTVVGGRAGSPCGKGYWKVQVGTI